MRNYGFDPARRCCRPELVSGLVKCQWLNFIVPSFPWFPPGKKRCWRMQNICCHSQKSDTCKKTSSLSVLAVVEQVEKAKSSLKPLTLPPRLVFSCGDWQAGAYSITLCCSSICSISTMSPEARPVKRCNIKCCFIKAGTPQLMFLIIFAIK